MHVIAVSFIILFGSTYGVSSILLRKNFKVHDPTYKSRETLTAVYKKAGNIDTPLDVPIITLDQRGQGLRPAKSCPSIERC